MLGSIIGLADAHAEPVIVNGLVGALPHRLAALVGQISTHLGRHWGQLKLVLTAAVENLPEVIRLVLRRCESGGGEWGNWQLEMASGRLWHVILLVLLLSVTGGMLGCLWGLGWQQGRQEAWLCEHKLRFDLLVEAGSGLTRTNRANRIAAVFLTFTATHVASCSCYYDTETFEKS